MVLKLQKSVHRDQNFYQVASTWQLFLMCDDSDPLNFMYRILKSPDMRITALTIVLPPSFGKEQQANPAACERTRSWIILKKDMSLVLMWVTNSGHHGCSQDWRSQNLAQPVVMEKQILCSDRSGCLCFSSGKRSVGCSSMFLMQFCLLRGQRSVGKCSIEWCRLNLSHVKVLHRLEICALDNASGLSAVHGAISFSLPVKREHVKTVSGLAKHYLATLPKSFTLTVVWRSYKNRAITKPEARQINRTCWGWKLAGASSWQLLVLTKICLI